MRGLWLRNGAKRFEHVHDDGALKSRSACDREVTALILVVLAASLGEVERNRNRGTTQLIVERVEPDGGTLGQGNGELEKLNGAAVDVESVEIEHACSSAARAKSCVTTPTPTKNARPEEVTEIPRVSNRSVF